MVLLSSETYRLYCYHSCSLPRGFATHFLSSFCASQWGAVAARGGGIAGSQAHIRDRDGEGGRRREEGEKKAAYTTRVKIMYVLRANQERPFVSDQYTR